MHLEKLQKPPPFLSKGEREMEKIKEALKMSQYWIGLDVGKEGSIAYIYQSGEAHFIKSPQDLYKILGGKRAVVLVENTGLYSYNFENLNGTIRVFMINGLRSRAGKVRRGIRKKNDIRDAVNLAKILRDIAEAKTEVEVMEIPPVLEVMPWEQKYLRYLIKTRYRLKREIDKYKTRLEKIYFLYGIEKRFSGKSYYANGLIRAMHKLRELKTDDRYIQMRTERLLSEMNILKALIEEYRKVDEEIKEIVRKHGDYEKLKQIKGLGEEFIEFIISIYWDIKRFKDADAFKSYFKIQQRFDEESSKLKGKSKKRFKNGMLKRYIYMMTVRKKHLDEEIRKALEYYQQRHIRKRAKVINKFSSWLFKKLYLYLKEGRPIRFGFGG